MKLTNDKTNNRILGRLFGARYNASPQVREVQNLDFIDEILEDSKESPQVSYKFLIQDIFTPSEELQATMNAKPYVRDGLSDVKSFKAMAHKLRQDGILTKDELMAVDFLASKSKISFEGFYTTLDNSNLHSEMKHLMTQFVQKLQMVDYILGGVMQPSLQGS